MKDYSQLCPSVQPGSPLEARELGHVALGTEVLAVKERKHDTEKRAGVWKSGLNLR